MTQRHGKYKIRRTAVTLSQTHVVDRKRTGRVVIVDRTQPLGIGYRQRTSAGLGVA